MVYNFASELFLWLLERFWMTNEERWREMRVMKKDESDKERWANWNENLRWEPKMSKLRWANWDDETKISKLRWGDQDEILRWAGYGLLQNSFIGIDYEEMIMWAIISEVRLSSINFRPQTGTVFHMSALLMTFKSKTQDRQQLDMNCVPPSLERCSFGLRSFIIYISHYTRWASSDVFYKRDAGLFGNWWASVVCLQPFSRNETLRLTCTWTGLEKLINLLKRQTFGLVDEKVNEQEA